MDDEALAALHLPQRLELCRYDLLVRDRHREPSQRPREAVHHRQGFRRDSRIIERHIPCHHRRNQLRRIWQKPAPPRLRGALWIGS